MNAKIEENQKQIDEVDLKLLAQQVRLMEMEATMFELDLRLADSLAVSYQIIEEVKELKPQLI